MCGRYTLRQPGAIAERFHLTQATLLAESAPAPRYNIAPSQRAMVVLRQGDDTRAEWMQWGLVPSWSASPKADYATINARVEGIATKAAYRAPLRTQRCIVPADGFYEWTARQGRKQPYFIHLADDRLFGFAGLYDRWRGEDDVDLATFTIITTAASDAVKPLHPRMAVMLHPDDEAAWLDPTLTDPARLLPLLHPYAGPDLELYAVAPLVNKPANDGPALVAPLDTAPPATGGAPHLFE